MVLLKQDDWTIAYSVGSDFQPRPVTPSQLLSVIQCEPNELAAAMPSDTNERVQAAYAQAVQAALLRIGKVRRPTSDTKLRRYLNRQLKLARATAGDNQEEVRRIDLLIQIFLGHLPTVVIMELGEVQRVELTGPALVHRLEAIRSRHRLNPIDEPSSTASPGEILRILCSDGLL